jgi:LytS/YehU family sensor histidine kinase
MAFAEASKNAIYALVWAPLLVVAVWLTDRWPVRGAGDVRRIVLHVGAAIAAPFAWGTAAYYLCLWIVPGWQPWGVARTYLKTANGVLYVYSVVVLISHVVTRIRANRAREVAAMQAAESATRAQLQVLAMELQPHFLFNALHAVSALMFVDRAAAVVAVRRLAKMLRYAVRTAAAGEVTLAEELRALRRYTRIQELRFRDSLRITWLVPSELLRAAVPHFLLQPIVENAIKYGVESTSSAGRVEIAARRDGGWLVIQVTDDGLGPAASGRSRRLVSGRGLANARERLTRLYGDRQRLVLSPGPAGRGAIVEVRLPYHQLEVAREAVAGPHSSPDTRDRATA